MKLPSFFKKKETPQYFLSLLLREEKVSSIVFEEISGRIKILSQTEEFFENSIEDASEEEFLEVTDKVVSKSETQIPLSEKQKTVFGLKENWVENSTPIGSGSKIKKEYLLRLKKVCEALGLLPIGFLITHEAIANLLEKEEGAPPTAILIEVNKKTLTVTLIKAGKVLKTSLSKIEDSIPKTTDRILHHFTNFEVLPSKILLFDDKENENLIQEFINHSFSKSLPFLHVPQVSRLPSDFAAKAVVFGAASQMKMEIPKEENEKTVPRNRILPSETTTEAEAQNAEKTEDTEPIEKSNPPKEDGEEIINRETNEELEEDEIKESKGLAFGFKKDIDANQIKIEEEPKEEESLPDEQDEQEEPENFKLNLKKFTPDISFIKEFRSLRLPNFGNKAIFIPPFFLAFSLLLLIFYIFMVRAEVVMKISPKNIDEKYEVTFATNTKTDLAKGIIGSQDSSISKDGSVSKETQGKKEIGDKAKGSVTLYSRFTQEKTLPAQTILTSQNGLKFTLDLAVKISSSSGGASSQATTTKVSVTAKEIGKESNLPSGAKFIVSSFDVSDIEGKNETAFSGGTKKEIKVVSKEDYEELEKKLPEALSEKAKNELKNKIGEDKEILSDFTSFVLSKKEFSKKIGDEAENISMTGTVEFKGIIYKKIDLSELSKSKVSNSDMVFLENSSKTEVLNLKNKNEKEVSATLHLTASLIPKVSEKKLKEDLAGKSFNEGKRIIDKVPQVYETTMFLRPDFPLLPRILPRLAKNISLIIKTQ